MKMKSGFVASALMAVIGMGATGCDWEYGASADQTTGRFNQVNFTGIYRGIEVEEGVVGDLVSDHSGGKSILFFNVRQDGNDLRFTDNGGSVYEGTLGNVQFTGTPESWSQAFGQFSVRGTNHVSGLHITITGTLQAERATELGLGTTARRSMFATWLEQGGRTGDVRGRADPVQIGAGP